MASIVSICNLALSHIGDRAGLTSIDPPEGSAQASHCALFWPIARDEALSAYDWRFASTLAAPEVPGEVDLLDYYPRWQYLFPIPADCLVVREIVLPDGTGHPLYSSSEPDFELAAYDGETYIMCNWDTIRLRYTRRVEEVEKYPARLVTALTYLVASMLAGPVVKGATGTRLGAAMRQYWDKLSAEASVIDANQDKRGTQFIPSNIRHRGAVLERTVEDGNTRRELPYWAT